MEQCPLRSGALAPVLGGLAMMRVDCRTKCRTPFLVVRCLEPGDRGSARTRPFMTNGLLIPRPLHGKRSFSLHLTSGVTSSAKQRELSNGRFESAAIRVWILRDTEGRRIAADCGAPKKGG